MPCLHFFLPMLRREKVVSKLHIHAIIHQQRRNTYTPAPFLLGFLAFLDGLPPASARPEKSAVMATRRRMSFILFRRVVLELSSLETGD